MALHAGSQVRRGGESYLSSFVHKVVGKLRVMMPNAMHRHLMHRFCWSVIIATDTAYVIFWHQMRHVQLNEVQHMATHS